MSNASPSSDLLTETHLVAWARMARATNTVMVAVEAALKKNGLPGLHWYDLLLELYRARPQGLRPVRLQAEMLMPQSNMSRLIDRVEAAGCIRRIDCDDDGRGQLVEITQTGEDMLRRMWPVYRRVLQEAFARQVGSNAAADIAAALNAFGARRPPDAGSTLPAEVVEGSEARDGVDLE